ncbi:GGDEF domain-containing protein [Acinetobacter sp. WZC-1]|uniref:GGDEF domain-containing protein n=1 Tax=Acinetobacter sp. WZC-1 TaxID=3459034 RepID=UPI00403DCFA2
MAQHDQSDFKEFIDTEHFLELLQKSEKLELVSLISQLPLPIAVLNENSRFIGVNQKFADIYESDALYLNGKLLNNFSPVVYTQFVEVLQAFGAGESQVDFEFYAQGHFYLSYFQALRNRNHQLMAVVVICADVTRLKRREHVLLLNNKKLHDHLYLDAVTGLPNKLAFDRFVTDLMHDHQLTELTYAFLKIDLDAFRQFNQLYSYSRGDKVLARIGTMLSDEMSQDVINIFRLNSASFVVVVENSTEWAVLTLAERLKFAIYQQNIEFKDGLEDKLTASIGICHIKSGTLLAEIDFLQQLDCAVHHAKLKGKNSIYALNL